LPVLAVAVQLAVRLIYYITPTPLLAMSKNKSKNNNNGPETIVMILVGLPGMSAEIIKT
jgi:hypothetical protein